ncbi:MAG TPA: WXG100 family type VII secretion target [Ilumatobacter sp.]|nr:WXG100 family type VII secretion target [Ilumatobacter sp.]
MSNFTGMDIAGVRQLANQFSQKADEIDGIRNFLTSQLNSTQWVGNDRERFVGDWQGQYTTALNTVVNALREAQQTALRNAQEQETTSNS